MVPVTVAEILKATNGRLICGDEKIIIDNITTDSRSKEGGLFIALIGERFDGHDYIKSFFENGGSAVISQKQVDAKCVILVDDTKKALLDIAAYYKSKFNIPLVAVTGSVGKTSTKDMLASVLQQQFITHKTEGNFNNEIGLPLTLLKLTEKHEMAVVEMGMNNFGEIKRLTTVAKPSVAVITNIGTAHIGKLGSQEGILKAKLEILEGLPADGMVILNADDNYLNPLKGKIPYKVVSYSINNLNADIVAYDIVLGADKTKFKFKFEGKEYIAVINVVGEHHIYNALAALITGIHFKIPVESIIEGIKKFTIGDMRQNIITISGVKLIIDCYNASPQSVDASLKVLNQIAGGRCVAVLGDMQELGDFAENAHKQVGSMVANLNIDLLVAVGQNSKYTAKQAQSFGVKAFHFDCNDKAIDYLLKEVQPGDTILFKASRAMKLEQISNAISERLGYNWKK